MVQLMVASKLYGFCMTAVYHFPSELFSFWNFLGMSRLVNLHTFVTETDLQRTFFRMKRNFEKKQKNIAREYSMERKEEENSWQLHLPGYICLSTF